MSQDRGEDGTFTERTTDSEVLRALSEQPDPVTTARELAEVLTVSSETVRRHLVALHDRGDVDCKKVSGRAVVWWSVDDDEPDEPAPAAPLQDLVGMLEEDTADTARSRSREWRDAFADEIATVRPSRSTTR